MIREIGDFIQDILDATNDIERFIKGLDFESFSKDRKTVYAVIRAIEIMGEAAKNIHDTVRSNYPEVPWKQITGMRDKLIHGYFGIDMRTLWKAATQDAPELKALITKIRKEV